MFSQKLAALVLLAAPLSLAVQIEVPKNPASGTTVTINWTTESTDPGTWSLELKNIAFNNAYAIANNVDPSLGSITLDLPAVPPGDGYTLEAVNIGNINEVYGTSGGFAVADVPATVTSVSSASAISLSSTASSGSISGSSSAPATTSRSSTSAFGVTASGSSTSTGPRTISGSSTSSASSTSPSSSTTPLNGAASLQVGGGAFAFVAAVAAFAAL